MDGSLQLTVVTGDGLVASNSNGDSGVGGNNVGLNGGGDGLVGDGLGGGDNGRGSIGVGSVGVANNGSNNSGLSLSLPLAVVSVCVGVSVAVAVAESMAVVSAVQEVKGQPWPRVQPQPPSCRSNSLHRGIRIHSRSRGHGRSILRTGGKDQPQPWHQPRGQPGQPLPAKEERKAPLQLSGFPGLSPCTLR